MEDSYRAWAQKPSYNWGDMWITFRDGQKYMGFIGFFLVHSDVYVE